MLRQADVCARLKLVALNNDSGLSILCGTDVLNMLKSHLTDAIALLFCLCASPCPTNARAPETHILPVTVVTVEGKPVANLQSHNVHIHGGGAQVKSFSLDIGPRRIVLLLDTSGSMGTNDDGKPRLAVAAELMNICFWTPSPKVIRWRCISLQTRRGR